MNSQSLGGKKSKHSTCSWAGGRAEQSSLPAKQINTCVESQGGKGELSSPQPRCLYPFPTPKCSILSYWQSWCFWKSYFQHFSEGVGLVLPTEPGMSVLGNHQHASTIPDTQLLRQGCNSSATKLGKDISGVTLLNPSVLHRSCPVSRL